MKNQWKSMDFCSFNRVSIGFPANLKNHVVFFGNFFTWSKFHPIQKQARFPEYSYFLILRNRENVQFWDFLGKMWIFHLRSLTIRSQKGHVTLLRLDFEGVEMKNPKFTWKISKSDSFAISENQKVVILSESSLFLDEMKFWPGKKIPQKTHMIFESEQKQWRCIDFRARNWVEIPKSE